MPAPRENRMQRNYSELSPFDFECLVRDLLQEQFGELMEVFPIGRDGGIDIRLLSTTRRTILVQCKHHPGRTFAQVRSSFRAEARAISKHAGSINGQYWVATSASLTAANKREVAEMFSKVNLQPEHILARSDCDNLLNLSEAIERRHYKLYMTSVGILKRLLSPELFYRLEALSVDIAARAKTFVRTAVYDDAEKTLNSMGTCILVGPAGAGKTTAAYMLCFDKICEGYELVVASQDIADAERLYDHSRRQVFFYDDFLGQNTLGPDLNKNEDSRLLSFIRRMEAGSSHRLVLSTRDYTLADAAQQYQKLSRSEIQNRVIRVDHQSYSREVRARILFNLLFFADLPDGVFDTFLARRTYLRVIDHANYNPRMIEFGLSLYASEMKAGRKLEPFDTFLMESLANPDQLWSHAFEQVGLVGRDIIVTIWTFGGWVNLDDLAIALRSMQLSVRGKADDLLAMQATLRKLDGTFLVSHENPGQHWGLYRLANASIKDFVELYVTSSPLLSEQLADAAVSFEQLEELARVETSVSVMHHDLSPMRNQYDAAASYQEKVVYRMSSLIGNDSRVKVLNSESPERTRSTRWSLSDRLAVIVGYCEDWALVLPEQSRVRLVSTLVDRLASVAEDTEEEPEDLYRLIEYFYTQKLHTQPEATAYVAAVRAWLEANGARAASFMILRRIYKLLDVDMVQMERLERDFGECMKDVIRVEVLPWKDYEYVDTLTDEIWAAIREFGIENSSPWFKAAMDHLRALESAQLVEEFGMAESEAAHSTDTDIDFVFSGFKSTARRYGEEIPPASV